MKLNILFTAVFASICWLGLAQNSEKDIYKTKNGELTVQPVLHGSLVLTYNTKTIFVDPYGGADLYSNFNTPDIILITDIHGDHLNFKTLDALNSSIAEFIVPKAVADKLPEKYHKKLTIINNGQGVHRLDMFINAIPMYNLPEDAASRHIKGRGNGYVLHIDDKRIYISGDTEDITEMRNLQKIDIAFICMNLPYTMNIKQAASAVLDFTPKIVYPYHYRGKNGLSDVNSFKKMVNEKNKNIQVQLKNWYPSN